RTATPQFLRNLRCLQPKAVQFGYPIVQGVFAVSSCPALLPVLVGIQLRFEWIHILAMQISVLLEAPLKSCAFGFHVVRRPSECDDRVKDVLALRRAALRAIFAAVMYEGNAATACPLSKRPCGDVGL